MTIASMLSDNWSALWRRRADADAPPRLADPADLSGAPPDVRRLIREHRYCKILDVDGEVPFDEASINHAWKAVAGQMALVPSGEVFLARELAMATEEGFAMAAPEYQRAAVRSLYIDRYAVTNADYARFVAAGGYGNLDLWPAEVLPFVLRLVDTTGQPGPRFWRDGAPPADKADHPVVGVCWYEAKAYATWVAKRLPMPAEWQRAGTWANSHCGNGSESRYPWGNAFDTQKANTRAAGRGGTAPVDAFRAGRTVNGVHQLIGNVWEWVDAPFHPEGDGDVRVDCDAPMAEIRGGAYDTYFPSQATCQFRSGQPLFHRGANVGFRCCISGGQLPIPPDPAALLKHESDT